MAACVCLLAMASATPSLQSSASARANTCYEAFEQVVTCYSPAQVVRAEQRMPVAPLRPNTTVWQDAHLATTVVAVSVGVHWKSIVGINYVFGPLEPLECPARSLPRWLSVYEVTGHHATDDGSYIQLVCAGQTNFVANMPNRNLTLSLASNLPVAIVDKVGLDLLAQAMAMPLGNPTGTPRLARTKVLSIARAQAQALIRPHGYTLRFGSLRLGGRTVDVWSLQLTLVAPPLHARLILIEDAAARVLRTAQY
jgi:hypothetical protein